MMKSLKSTLLALIGAVCATTMLVACAGNDSNTSDLDQRLAGTWITRTIASQSPSNGPFDCQPGGATVNLGGGNSADCGANDRITLNSNGSWGSNRDGSGTWSTRNNVLTIASPGADSDHFNYSVTTNQLNISGPDGTSTVMLTLGRILG